MPDPSLSDAIKEARAVCPTNVFEINTLEISHPVLSVLEKELDVCFVIDTSVSMQPAIDSIAAEISQVATDLSADFATIRFSLVDYTTAAATVFVTGETFVDLATFQTAIDGLTTGGDTENAFYAAKLAADTLDWNPAPQVARAMVLITNEKNDNDGTTEQSVIDALGANEITFFLGLDESEEFWFQSFIDATGGARIDAATNEQIRTQLVAAFDTIPVITEGGERLYIVNDTKAHSLPLELGGEPVDFLVRGFNTRLTGSGENGLQNLSITIDDIDRKVSQFIKKATALSSPVELAFRVYLSDDLTQPQNDPPLILYVTGASRDAEGMNVTASTIDVVNAPFPRQLYRLENFPLQ